jgi:hypothetical protein
MSEFRLTLSSGIVWGRRLSIFEMDKIASLTRQQMDDYEKAIEEYVLSNCIIAHTSRLTEDDKKLIIKAVTEHMNPDE